MTEFEIIGPVSAPCLDILTGCIDGVRALKLGTLTHQLMELFLRIPGKLLSALSIFSSLMASEYFNPHSSPDRVRQIIRRTRRWLEVKAIPVVIACKKGLYGLNIVGHFSFRVPLVRQAVSYLDLQFQRLKTAFGEREFSAKSAREKLEMPKSTFLRLLNWGIERGKIVRVARSYHEVVYHL